MKTQSQVQEKALQSISPSTSSNLLQRKATNETELTQVPPIVYEVLRSPGQPLDAETRAFMEPRFGYDFGQVRVHTDKPAADSAQAVNALAYTVGSHIVFNNKLDATARPPDSSLLAHELVHSVQQARQNHLSGQLTLQRDNAAPELEAVRIVSALSPSSVLQISGRSPIQVMRKPNQVEEKSTTSRKDRLEIFRDLVELASDSVIWVSQGKRPELAKVAIFTASLLSQVVMDPKVINWLQKQNQLPGTLGSIRASQAEIFRNIGAGKRTARLTSSSLSILAQLPIVFKTFEGLQKLADGEYDAAIPIFTQVALVPGIEKIVKCAIDILETGGYSEDDLREGRDSLINVVTAGAPGTIDLFIDLIYEITGNGEVPTNERFRMDLRVLDKGI